MKQSSKVNIYLPSKSSISLKLELRGGATPNDLNLIFIPKGKRDKDCNYDFVRFRYESEMRKVVRYRSGISVDGRRFNVKEADPTGGKSYHGT